MSRIRTLIVCVVTIALTAPLAWAQTPLQYTKVSTDGTPIPDVDKSNPSDPTDASCWLASAANILGAAGYGPGGLPAQQRAQSIYGQLTTAYGTTSGGAPDQAISYWLAHYGKNPGSSEYRPNLNYTDVTAEYRSLGANDYTFLKDELYRCQYVGVQFENPSHAVTFAGWDDNLNQSFWTDSDVDQGGTDLDIYNNAFQSNPDDWDLLDPATGTTYLDHANGYVTFCPGLNKDPNFVMNYDVAWAPSPSGPAMREAGEMTGVFDPAPGWQSTNWTDPNDSSAVFDVFLIDNEPDLEREKHIQLLVDYYDRDANYLNEDIRIRYMDEFGSEAIALPSDKTLSSDEGQVLFEFVLEIQPEWEEILFPTGDYRMLEGDVASWDCALICVPEPATLALLGVGGLALLRRRKQ